MKLSVKSIRPGIVKGQKSLSLGANHPFEKLIPWKIN
jgi:hypothetical protein